MGLLSKIKDAYINNLPNIEDMECLAITIGYSVEYRYSLCGRWLAWLCFKDCEYVLIRNNDDMRGYTS